MTGDTYKPLALMGELILALRVNDYYSFKGWLSFGIRELGKPAVAELMFSFMTPIMTSEDADRMVAWHLGVSL